MFQRIASKLAVLRKQLEFFVLFSISLREQKNEQKLCGFSYTQDKADFEVIH